MDLNGCREATTDEVLVINAQKIFTPNNDTYFDTWNIIGIETLPGSVIYVFDRFGKLTYQINSQFRQVGTALTEVINARN